MLFISCINWCVRWTGGALEITLQVKSALDALCLSAAVNENRCAVVPKLVKKTGEEQLNATPKSSWHEYLTGGIPPVDVKVNVIALEVVKPPFGTEEPSPSTDDVIVVFKGLATVQLKMGVVNWRPEASVVCTENWCNPGDKPPNSLIWVWPSPQGSFFPSIKHLNVNGGAAGRAGTTIQENVIEVENVAPPFRTVAPNPSTDDVISVKGVPGSNCALASLNNEPVGTIEKITRLRNNGNTIEIFRMSPWTWGKYKSLAVKLCRKILFSLHVHIHGQSN
jgi:hypothetical protein